METTALLWLLNDMTHSPFLGTLMVTLRYLPMVVFAFIGGIIADRIDRRHLLIYALSASASFSLILAVFVHLGLILPWHLLFYSALMGVITSFNHPARSTLLPNLIKREHFLNAMTLDNASVTTSRILGAPLAGFIIGFYGTTPVLGLRAVGAVLAIIWLLQIRSPAKLPEAEHKSPWHSFTEGILYVAKHKDVLTQVLLYLLPYFVTNTYTGLLPSFATDNLHIGPGLYGILNAAPGLGAVLASFTLASFLNLRRKGLFLLLAGIIQGLSLIIFAFSSLYLVALILLTVIGGVNTTYMTLNNTMIQELISDQVRGRVMSLREVCHGLGPSGSLISGGIAGAFSVPIAMAVAGAISLIVLTGILIGIPQTRHRGEPVTG